MISLEYAQKKVPNKIDYTHNKGITMTLNGKYIDKHLRDIYIPENIIDW